MNGIFAFPTRIVFGAGTLKELPQLLKSQGMKRPLVVTDRGLLTLPVFARLKTCLVQGGLEPQVFSDISPNPTAPEVEAGGRFYREARTDSIVALGGGSALDAAKAIRLLATHDGAILDYDDDLGGSDKIRPDVPYMVALATTAGTGSEVGRSSVITDPARNLKRIIFSPHLLASVVIADPELTVDLPPHLTAATGMDALSHCIESYLATGFHPMCDAIALGGVQLILKHLARAVNHGKDIEARGGMLMAAMMGAVAFQKGLGMTHSLAHPLTTVAGVHHGLANGLMLARTMEFNRAVAEDRLADIARILDLAPGQGNAARAEAAIAAVRNLASEIKIPARLTDAGVKPDQLGAMVEQAVADGCHRTNPRPCQEADFRRLYSEAM
jgi:4-hydroxybutyrate dehydrogenase